MVSDFEDELELLALTPRGRAEYRVRTLQQYGNGEIDPYCRANLFKRGIRTRITDRDIELVFGRGGDTAYLVMETGEPDTYQEKAVEWLPVDPNDPEKGYRVVGGGMRTRLEQGPDGKLRPKYRKAQMAIETDELTEGIPQEARFNFHMMSKLQLNRELALLHRQRRENPLKRVPYPRAGCSPIGNLKSPDKVSWRDAEYRRAILQKRKNKRSLVARQVHDLPPGLYYNKELGDYEVRIGCLNLHGLRIIAHNRVERRSRRAKEAYEQLMEALVNQAVRGRPEDRLTAWEILAKFGENGLRTGSDMFYDAIFKRPESSWIYPDDGARGRAFRRFAYQPLLVEMKAALHKAYDIDPEVTSVEDYDPFWKEEDHAKRYGATWPTIDPRNQNNRHDHKPWIKLVSDFIEANFDRSFPSEQYQYGRMLSRIFGAHDKKSYRSKAKAMQRIEELTIHVIKYPKFNWVYEPKGSDGLNGEWKLNIDWSTFDYFAEGIEAVRDWVRMIGEWKFTKSARNSFDAMSFESRTADSLRGNDWGGIWNPVPYWACWSFWLEYLFADSRPSVLDENGMPIFDADGNRKWYRRAPMPIMPAEPPKSRPEQGDDESPLDYQKRLVEWRRDKGPKRSPLETHAEWQARVTEWTDKYVDSRPIRSPEPIRGADESDETWEARYNAWVRDWKATLQQWELACQLQWVKDIEAFNQAIDRRVVFMGWAWYDRDPDADMPHDGALRQMTAQKWADWLAMVVQARGFNSLLGDGLVPDMTTFIKEQSSKVRNYVNETHWMESDEGAHHDPQAFWGYMGGILRAHIVSMLNYRLQAFRDSPDFFKILFKITDARDESATTIRDQLNLMWDNAPLKGVQMRLWKIFDDARHEDVIDMRPLFHRFLDGLPRNLLERLQPLIRGLNRRADRRVRAWASHLSIGRHGGKRAFTMAQKFIDNGYGLNTGERLMENGLPLTIRETEQKRQDELGLFGWLNIQYDKAVPFVRGLVLREYSEVFVDAKENAEHVIKLIEGGLWVDLAWEVLEIASERGLFIKAEDWFPNREAFNAAVKKTKIEEHFEDKLREYLGTYEFRVVFEGLLFEAMKEAPDPKPKQVAAA